MDRITQSLLNEFSNVESIGTLEESTQFEHFTGYLVTSKHYSDTFSSFDVHVGSGGDSAIDSIAIVANGLLVKTKEEINDLVETNGYLDVTLVFNQAERSGRFSSEKISQIGYGIRDFLSEDPTLVQNTSIRDKASIITEIFNNSSRFKKGNPRCIIYYSTTGRWQEDQNLFSRIEAVKTDIDALSLFREVVFTPVGSNQLQELYIASKNAVSIEINFVQRSVLPEIGGIEEAYIGYLPGTEFIKLIENDEEEINRALFYDNVRDWQEWNDVNKGMADTIKNGSLQSYFVLYNNGITVIAKSIITTGNKFIIEDYQIVNGCQTSYVLHYCKDEVTENLQVPVRLIATEDQDIKNAIIKSTNRQTQITDEQLFALTDFSKRIEVYFPTFDGMRKLYFERRSRQYNSDSSVEKVRVINMATLVKSFASAILRLPHRATRSYKSLASTLGTQILAESHREELYYVSCYIHYRLEYLFRSQYIDPKYKVA